MGKSQFSAAYLPHSLSQSFEHLIQIPHMIPICLKQPLIVRQHQMILQLTPSEKENKTSAVPAGQNSIFYLCLFKNLLQLLTHFLFHCDHAGYLDPL